MTPLKLKKAVLLTCFAAVMPTLLTAEIHPNAYSPYVRTSNPDKVYWGDTHVHTDMSPDAFGFGNRLGPDDAYRFAKGQQVETNNGQPAKLSRPLDFIVVADHAEYLGVTALLTRAPKTLNNSEIGQRWLRALSEGQGHQILMDGHQISMGEKSFQHDELVLRSSWQKVIEGAERHNDPGRFTAFIGYEWSALPGGNNLHRNVIFRDGADKVEQVMPFSALDSDDPESLWQYMKNYEVQWGGKVMAIPHNPNLSNGMMFSDISSRGEPLTQAYADERRRWEPLLEVTQMKGDSETHPFLSPDDAFADFERWDRGNFSRPQVPKKNTMLASEYARAALQKGLQHHERIQSNPFKFGMIGSTDTHIALAGIEENNFLGKFSVNEPSKERAHLSYMNSWEYVSSGYAAVWAKDNTREALFDAMQRREVYATTGPRLMLRFFGGWTFDPEDAMRPNYAEIGYKKGVPMGADLQPPPHPQQFPKFMLVAAKDPMGANLDRVQIIKGWVDDEGITHEKVFDVLLSDDRTVNTNTGEVEALTSTVNLDAATYTNEIGDAQMMGVWHDSSFDASRPSFYYMRVLEIPTPRWTTYDAAFYGNDRAQSVPAQIQERAYSSPIWYVPQE